MANLPAAQNTPFHSPRAFGRNPAFDIPRPVQLITPNRTGNQYIPGSSALSLLIRIIFSTNPWLKSGTWALSKGRNLYVKTADRAVNQ
jgi:hypothetical protein